MDSQLHDEPSHVSVEAEEVHVNGPDGVAVALTADAAAETSDRLLAAATVAKGRELEARRIAEQRRVDRLK